MAQLAAKSGAKHAQIEATVIRADGTIEHLGTVADSKWGRFSISRLLASRRIQRANSKTEA